MKSLRTPSQKALVEHLKQMRQAAEMTQTELAQALGTHQSFVAKIESAERRIDVVEFCRWLSACGKVNDAQKIIEVICEKAE